jgi:hypothetical protein
MLQCLIRVLHRHKTYLERKHRFIEKKIIKAKQEYIIIAGFGENVVLVI